MTKIIRTTFTSSFCLTCINISSAQTWLNWGKLDEVYTWLWYTALLGSPWVCLYAHSNPQHALQHVRMLIFSSWKCAACPKSCYGMTHCQGLGTNNQPVIYTFPRSALPRSQAASPSSNTPRRSWAQRTMVQGPKRGPSQHPGESLRTWHITPDHSSYTAIITVWHHSGLQLNAGCS